MLPQEVFCIYLKNKETDQSRCTFHLCWKPALTDSHQKISSGAQLDRFDTINSDTSVMAPDITFPVCVFLNLDPVLNKRH